MSMRPQISIGMPVYNGEKFINEAIDSVLAQTFTDFELIISDNDSTDRTADICKEYCLKDSRIRYVRQPRNIGGQENFKFVLDEARADYFMWAAADDSSDPAFIEKLHSVFLQHPNVVLAMSDVLSISEEGVDLGVKELGNIRVTDVENRWGKIRWRFFDNPTTNIYFCIYGLYRTSVLKSVQLNYKGMVSYAAGSEIPFLAQISLLGKIASIPEPLKIYRIHDSSVYHAERKNISISERVKNNLNITLCLFRIAVDSKLPLSNKIYVVGRTTMTTTRWVFRHLAGQLLRKVILK